MKKYPLPGKFTWDGKFTDNALRMLTHAVDRSIEREIFGAIPVISVLWAILRWERKLALVALEKCGVDIRAIERDIEAELDAISYAPKKIEFDFAEIQSIARIAYQEALNSGMHYAGAEHLILALLNSEDPVARKILANHHLTHDQFRTELRDLQNRHK